MDLLLPLAAMLFIIRQATHITAPGQRVKLLEDRLQATQ